MASRRTKRHREVKVCPLDPIFYAWHSQTEIPLAAIAIVDARMSVLARKLD